MLYSEESNNIQRRVILFPTLEGWAPWETDSGTKMSWLKFLVIDISFQMNTY